MDAKIMMMPAPTRFKFIYTNYTFFTLSYIKYLLSYILLSLKYFNIIFYPFPTIIYTNRLYHGFEIGNFKNKGVCSKCCANN